MYNLIHMLNGPLMKNEHNAVLCCLHTLSFYYLAIRIFSVFFFLMEETISLHRIDGMQSG